MQLNLDLLQTFMLSLLVLFGGGLVTRRVYFLRKYNIPEPVVGGIIFSVLAGVLFTQFNFSLILDTQIRETMMLCFFATIGLGANLKLLRRGGVKLLIFLVAATLLVVFQDLLGMLLAKVLGLHPYIGLLAGSITLSGGHGTGATWAVKFAEVPGAMEIAMACATFGLVFGGVIGGPVAESLIARYRLAPDEKVRDPAAALRDHGMDEPETVTAKKVFEVIFLVALCVGGGSIVQNLLQEQRLPVPTFIYALFMGIILTNSLELMAKYTIPKQTLDLVSVLTLTMFLVQALMGLKLWELINLALPLLVILLMQTVIMWLFAYWVTFRLMGRDYEAAVVAGGHCGFGLGATANAIANMEAIVMRYGPAPQAFLTVPVVGAFFIDVINAGIIQGFVFFFERMP